MFKFILCIALFAVCQGSVVQTPSRSGFLNSYFIYSRDNPRVPLEVFPTSDSVNQTNFRNKIAIVVHGHRGSGTIGINPIVKDAFLTSEDVTVIVVDWSAFASQSYSNAVSAVPSVGASLAEFIQLLASYNKVSYDQLHLVGFGLGAHVVGFAGRRLGGSIARITGLDPSGSQWGSNSQRLRSSDAVYVEVIHTDGDSIMVNGIGTVLGDVDFFPNGGNSQPGCLTHSCSHNRAWELFAASLTHNHLIGNQCASNLQLNMNLCRGFALHMGNNVLVKYGAGIFRVNTRRTYPY